MALGKSAADIEPPASLTDKDIVAALDTAAARLKSDFPPDAVYGTYFRTGRKGSDRTYPVGGGGLRDAAMATPRNIGFVKQGNVMVGTSGQTQTQIVQLSRPPRSYMVIPLGNSDHADSPHFDDQAAKLFSKGQAKDTYFLRRTELESHTERKYSLTY